ncbi:putative vomeronasal receptor-like protein 4 [Ochotona princeps]|uniref:putative vomeronasal receptor-like protein 4 n=1 Tax=Ochotona princeps TaxID=9978 RepID=UPI002714EB93|nr:putative vomeronasal receptor-like protein 4 [Ochotona princeps]
MDMLFQSFHEDTLSHIIQKMSFLSLTGPGILGNFLMLLKHVRTLVMSHEKNSIDLILIQLAISNIVIICTTGIRDITTMVYFSNFLLGDIVCKIMVYLSRVARGISICTTCLLSVVQAITISPRNTLWRKFKPHTTWQVLPHLLLFWVFSFLISSNLLHYITAVNKNESNVRMYVGYCYMLPAPQIVRWLFLCLMALRDLMFQTLMGCSSGYMALYLYKHHKRVLYLQSSRFAKYPSPEIRATQSTLILMACFLFFYWTDFILSFYTGITLSEESTTLHAKIFLEVGYCSLSPFVLLSRNIHITGCWSAH